MISVVILTKNEEKNIEDCLQNLQWCDEIIVIDDFSTDKTTDQIRQNSQIRKKIKIHQRKLNDDFATQRNFGLEKAHGDWVLFMDSDEELSRDLALEIKHILEAKSQQSAIAQKCDGFYVRRKDYFLGKWLKHGETNIKLLRLAKKGAGRWIRKVHEIWRIQGPVGELANPILHYPHPRIKDFLKEINTYSTLHAQVAYEEGERTNYLKIILKPKLKFLLNYIWRLGFLDGTEGFVMAIMMSFHSFLSQGKLWQIQQEKKISS